MEAQYYKEYFEYERKHWFFRARNKIIMDHITSLVGPDKKLRILNVGVATGHTSELLKNFAYEIISIEYDEACFNFTNAHVKDIGLQKGSILELQFENDQFDLVCAFDVLEHVEDDQLGMQELERVCKSEGHVVVTVPAFMSLWSHHDVINHHFRRYKLADLKRLFGDQKRIHKISYFNSILFIPVYLFRKLNNLLGITSNDQNSGDKVGSDLQMFNEKGIVSSLLFKIFSSESKMLKRGINFPFGVSLLASYKK